MRKYSGTTSSRETERERRNRRIAREAGGRGHGAFEKRGDPSSEKGGDHRLVGRRRCGHRQRRDRLRGCKRTGSGK